jgi:hypothetical protein
VPQSFAIGELEIMTPEIEKIVAQIQALQAELERQVRKAEEELQFRLTDGRIRFSREMQHWQRKYRIGVVRYLLDAKPMILITAPVIYAMLFPLLMLDISITLYQHICFRVYGIPRIKREEYVVMDRHKLAYLNIIEKVNCVYCGYGNGVIAYTREIISCTERYWCPIRHAQTLLDTHKRYDSYAPYGDAAAFRKIEEEDAVGSSTSSSADGRYRP